MNQCWSIVTYRHTGTKISELCIKTQTYLSTQCIWTCRLQNVGHFLQAPMCYVQIKDETLPAKTRRDISPYEWGRVTHKCVSKLTIIGSDNGLSPVRRQAIIWTNTGISLIGPLGTNFSGILIEIDTFSSKKLHFKMSLGKRRPFCLGLNVLTRGSITANNNNIL